MTITEFLQLSAGKWFSQRTSHQLANQQSDQANSTIFIELLAADRPEVIALCQQHDINPLDPRLAGGGIQVVSQPQAQWNAPKTVALVDTTTLLVPLVDLQQPQTGQLLWTTDQKKMAIGHFSLGSDEALVLTLTNQSFHLEERISFASPNLRMRTSAQKSSAGWSLASFCSEIRMSAS